MSHGKERRAHRRAPLEAEAWVARDGARLHAKTTDLSVGGVGLSAHVEWKTGDDVELTFELPDSSDTLTVTARVAWRREEWVGVSFTAITEEQEKRIQGAVNAALSLGAEEPTSPGALEDDGTTGETDPPAL